MMKRFHLYTPLAVVVVLGLGIGNTTIAAEPSIISLASSDKRSEEAPHHKTCADSDSDNQSCSDDISSRSISSHSSTSYYCASTPMNSEYEILTSQNCFRDSPLVVTQSSDFVIPYKLPPGAVTPILWRNAANNENGGKIVSQYAFQTRLPSKLIDKLLNYTSSIGITDKFRELTSTSAAPPQNGGEFISFGKNRWYVERPDKSKNIMHHIISPADEYGHEEYIKVLFDGGFHQVLESIGQTIELDGLAIYQLKFMAVSKSERGDIHVDTFASGGRTYNVIIPLLVEEDVGPELILLDDISGERGLYKYQVGMATLIGDDVEYGTMECDYTNERDGEWKYGGVRKDGGREGMNLVASVYIADIHELNVKSVMESTMSQAFPLMDQNWMFAQRGRHWWKGEVDEDSTSLNEASITKKKEWSDKGRARFLFGDKLDDCTIRAKEGMCENDLKETRKLCVKSCNIYFDFGPSSTMKLSTEDSGGETMYQVCIQNRMADQTCQTYSDGIDIKGDFVVPKKKLEAGEVFPIIWREDGSQTTPYAFQVGLPPELTTELLKYCNALGMTDLFRDLVGDDPIEALESGEGPNGKFVSLADGNRWYAQRPEEKWTSNMHWIGPADERTHEDYIKVLAEGNLDVVLDGIGKYLGLDSLAVYHLTFLAVSHSEKGYLHRDTHSSGASVYNIIIPIILEDEALPELEISDWWDESKKGSLKYQVGIASMMGDDAMHATQTCDYREKKGMRMAATVYIADINEANYKQITSSTLTQIFPLPDDDWLWAQRGRHWGGGASLKSDEGREAFSVSDHFIDCEQRVERGMCESDSSVMGTRTTRKQCLKSCKVYEEDGNDQSWYVDEYDKEEEYEEWYYLTPFFDNHWDYSCVDSSDECEDGAGNGLCLTDPEHMKEIGCHRSCLFCFAADSRDLFSLGTAQVLESDDDDANEREVPGPVDVLEVIMRTEQYLVNKVFVATDHEHVRLSCRNYDEKCAIWAAQGYCEDERGDMGKTCPAACQDCQMIDYTNRCPIDEDTNVFNPGDMGDMFKRILEECGDDVASFSVENLPAGGTHPFGQVTVVSSPYDDMNEYLNREEIDAENDVSPLPWVLLIEGFLSEEECDVLISMGNNQGYKRSSAFSGDFEFDGSPKFEESDHRTSENSFCDDECSDDPIVQGVLKRMENITGIPMTNYEPFQLVRYEVGQYYRQHHDCSDTMDGTVEGHRILTFFMYLNDVEQGGGTKFADLDYIASPKRGSALIWPSVTDADLEILDEWTYHEALKVERGIKFGANSWIHLRDYQGAPEYC